MTIVDAGHPLRIAATDEGPSPRVLVRHGLEAELSHSLYYELAEIALAENSNGVWSCGTFFPLEPASSASSPTEFRAALGAPAAEAPLEGDLPELRASASAEAAVLIAVTDRDDPGLILTVRREHLRTHAGQIAFPAGASRPTRIRSLQPFARRTRKSCWTPHPSRSREP